ncbi:MAG TPA: thioredoxin domain-containing protein [Acidimicrobiales bacterium]|jgi:hypothetical protein|nr:thioredoxin domain-containing protein [Acidimicrobiales bacterium]
MNRLADESSPYLRQHAENPVDWYPWGPEAFARARAEDRPVLLSVGYSACHWCHVMAHESFEDGPTAAIMNNLFVNVKVDREERPDVDAIYMDAVQAMTGHGGWPMTVFLAPDGRPFFGGTYFPKSPRQGMPSFTQLLENVHDVWVHRRDDLLAQAEQLTAAIERQTQITPDATLPGSEVLTGAGLALRRQHDAAWGGFGGAPKFPQSMSLDALLRVYAHNGDDDILHAVTNSLDAMASGGIYDHLGGGFARYSVDAQWLVPHFEKMLYDNALLARVYLHAWQITGKPRYRQVLDETIEYLLRDLHHPGGGFYSAEDADSEGEEGRFYVFSRDEVRSVLEQAGLAHASDEVVDWYGITEGGNFEGHNILFRPVRGDLMRPAAVEAGRAALFEHRARRVRPGLDDKVLTEWNGLALAALAEAAAVTGNGRWLDEAQRTGAFLCTELRVDGRLLRSWQADVGARHLAYAADHAALVDAFTRLAEATGKARWIAEAVATADAMLELFWDPQAGGLFTTGADAEALITRPKEILDNAVPSANSQAAIALLRLAALTGVDRYRERAEDILRLIGNVAAKHPTAFGNLLTAVDLHASGITEVVVSGTRPDLVRPVHERYLPNVVLAWGEPYDSPLWAGRDASAAYVCRNYACLTPAHDVDTLRAQLVS